MSNLTSDEPLKVANESESHLSVLFNKENSSHPTQKKAGTQKSMLSSKILKFRSDNLLDQKNSLNGKCTFNYDFNSSLIKCNDMLINDPLSMSDAVSKPRKISSNPYRVLEAPGLCDDFYLNLVDWSAQNILAVALESIVYVWNATTSTVQELCDVG